MEAQQIVQALVDRGMTQVQIAELTGMHQPTVSKILRGDVDDVMSRNYRKLASLLDERIAADPAGDGDKPSSLIKQEG